MAQFALILSEGIILLLSYAPLLLKNTQHLIISLSFVALLLFGFYLLIHLFNLKVYPSLIAMSILAPELHLLLPCKFFSLFALSHLKSLLKFLSKPTLTA